MDDLRAHDRLAIEVLTTGYAYAVDEGDWSGFEALFAPDATIDYRSAGGIAGTPAEVAAWMPEAMALFTWSMHSMSTQRIAFIGDDEAIGDVHVLARHGLMWEGDEELMDVSAVYHDRYVRTPEGWRFAARTEETLAIVGGRFAEVVRAGLAAG